MANTERANGFRPCGMRSGTPWNGKLNYYHVAAADATILGIGDLVVLDGTADTEGVARVTRAAADGVCVGVMMGRVHTNPDNLSQQHRAASTASYVLVADDPDILMDANEDAVGGALAVASVGLNVNFIVTGAASTTTGQSGMEVDSSTAATTNTLPLRIVGFVRSPENEAGVANARVLVAFNTHQFRANTGSTGV